jgi:tetratricopeptide (TPR) repeat protein
MPLKTDREDWVNEVRVRPLVKLGSLYADERDAARAEEAADGALRLLPPPERMGPSESALAVAIGELYFRIGGDAKAARLFRSAAARLGRLPPTAALGSAEAHLAAICKKTGRYEEASRLYREAIRIGRLQGQPTARFELPLARARVRAWLSRFGVP